MKMILKGILLYSTIIFTIIYLCAIDSVVNNTLVFVIYSLAILVLLALCAIYITEDDMYKLTFTKKENQSNEA
jgi:hypothetical protein